MNFDGLVLKQLLLIEWLHRCETVVTDLISLQSESGSHSSKERSSAVSNIPTTWQTSSRPQGQSKVTHLLPSVVSFLRQNYPTYI